MPSPELATGVTLLSVPDPRSPVVHRVVCDHLADGPDGPAYWIDARNAAVTHQLYDQARSRRALAPLRLARAFTAYQHYALVDRVAGRAGADTALVVVPNVGALYRDDDLADWERTHLRAATLERLAAVATECPVLLTTARDPDPFTAVADITVECVQTREGLRLTGEDLIPTGYWQGPYWQTTIPYWVDRCGLVEGVVAPAVTAHDRGLLGVEA